MSSEANLLIKSVDNLKRDTSCNNCCAFALNLGRLNNCSHLLCDTCFMLCGNCPVCGIKHLSKQLTKDEDIKDVLSHINAICTFNDLLKNDYNSNITYLFASNSFNYKRHHNGETRLHKDCRHGNLEQVEFLIKSGMDVNVQDYAGWTPLHEAVLNQRINIVKLLLAHGAFVNVPGLHYLTPLHSAIQENNVEIVGLLVKYGADCMMYNREGKTPLDLCSNSDIRNAICLTSMLPSIIRMYTVPEFKIYLHNVSKDIVKQFSTVPNVTLMKKNNLLKFGDVKYFVMGDATPNVKHLQAAMLQGACIVKMDLLTDIQLKKFPLNPMNYFADIPNYAVSKAAINTLNKLPKLFDGLHFYFVNITKQKIGDVPYTLEDIKSLIILGGGKIDVRAPSGLDHEVSYPFHANKTSKYATTSYYLLYDDTKNALKRKNYPKEIKYQTVQWMIDSINSFTILP